MATFEGGPRCCSGIRLLKLKPGGVPVALPPTRFPPEEQWALAFSPDSEQLVFAEHSVRRSGFRSAQLYEQPHEQPHNGGPLSRRMPAPLAQSGIPGAALLPSDVQEVEAWPTARSRSSRARGFTAWGKLSKSFRPTGTSAPRTVAVCPAPEVLADFSWSPASTSVVFDCRSPVNGSSRISTVWPDGTHLRDLLKSRRLTYVSVGETADGPQWSPNGSRLPSSRTESATALSTSGPSDRTDRTSPESAKRRQTLAWASVRE